MLYEVFTEGLAGLYATACKFKNKMKEGIYCQGNVRNGKVLSTTKPQDQQASGFTYLLKHGSD